MDTASLTDRLYRIEIDRWEGIPVCRVRWIRPRLLPKALLRSLGTIAAYRRIRYLWGKPDIIHAHVFSAGVLAALIGKFTRTPLVVTEHTTRFNQSRPPWAAMVQARIAYRLADRVLPVSRYLQEMLERRSLIGRFSVVPNIVDAALFHPSESGLRDRAQLLFVGALRRANRKGLPYLLEACRLLVDRGVDFHLDVLGDGPGRAACERAAARLGLSPRVSFRGAVPREDVAAAMQRASLLVSPSIMRETFCCPLAEAQASGLPIVATNVGASPETLSPGAGLLVPPADPRALADAILSALQDPDQWDRSSIIAEAQKFGLEPVSAKLASIYRDVLSHYSGRWSLGLGRRPSKGS